MRPVVHLLERLLVLPVLKLVSLFVSQRILSCKKAGSVLREARDRVVSLTTDAKARVIACHVSAEASPGSLTKKLEL